MTDDIDFTRGGVYMIRNDVNGKVYVGRAVNIRKRWAQHHHHLRTQTHHCGPLARSWQKHGEASFSFIVLCPHIDNEDDLCALEQYYIDAYDCLNRNSGYNLSPSSRGNRGTKYSNESRKRMSAAQKGRTFTDEAKAKISQSLTGKKATPEAIEKRREKLVGQVRTAEQCANLSAGLRAANGTKRLFAFGKEQYLKEWAIEYGINKGTLNNRLNRAGMTLEQALTIQPHKGARRDLHEQN